MKDIYDNILRKVQGGWKNTPKKGTSEYNACKYLEEKGFVDISEVSGMIWTISLTPKGDKFIADGGFKGKRRKNTLKKLTDNVTKLAIRIITGIVVTAMCVWMVLSKDGHSDKVSEDEIYDAPLIPEEVYQKDCFFNRINI